MNVKNQLCIEMMYLERLVELNDFDYEYIKPFSLDFKCSEEDRVAFQFGQTIQKAIINKDLEAIMSFIDGELELGFRKKFGQLSRFDDIFSQSNALRVLQCQSTANLLAREALCWAQGKSGMTAIRKVV